MNIQRHIIEGIKELLHHQDYVVIPGFGGFVAQMHMSRYLIEKNILTPPGKFISFNKQLKQNDGSLTLWLQSKLSISSDEAQKHLSEFSEYCSQVLFAKRRLNLESLGFFYLDFENNICFEPNTEVNYHADSFGLASIVLNELVEIKEEVITPKKEVVFEDRIIESVPEQKWPSRKRHLKPIAYIALGGSILFFTLSALVNLNQHNGPLWSGILNNNTSANYKPLQYSELNLAPLLSETPALVANANGIAVLELNKNTLAVKAIESTSVNSFSAKTANKRISGKFQIVLGCFSVQDNARGMVSKLKRKNINAEITGTNNKGMHVVSCAGFENKEEAQNYLQEIKSDFPSAWIKATP
jgi:nucleoid DNA-binding protein